MIGEETIAELEKLKWHYILGARMRRSEEVRNEVLLRGGKFTVVHPERGKASRPAPLQAVGMAAATCVGEGRKVCHYIRATLVIF